MPIRIQGWPPGGISEPPWGPLTWHEACSHKHTWRKIPMRICTFDSNRNHYAGNSAQQATIANPHTGLAPKRLFRGSLGASYQAPSMLSQTHVAQDTYADLLFLTQTAFTMPEFPLSKRQLPIRIEGWPPRGFSEAPWGPFTRHRTDLTNTLGARRETPPHHPMCF